MRSAWPILFVTFLLAACMEPPPITADMPTASCLGGSVSAAIDPQPGVKPSEHLALVERLACAYGQRESEASFLCSIEPNIPKYFPKVMDGDSYGLKDKTAVILLESEAYGSKLAADQAEWMGRHHLFKDVDICLSEINGSSKAIEDLEEYTRGLRKYGY